MNRLQLVNSQHDHLDRLSVHYEPDSRIRLSGEQRRRHHRSAVVREQLGRIVVHEDAHLNSGGL